MKQCKNVLLSCDNFEFFHLRRMREKIYHVIFKGEIKSRRSPGCGQNTEITKINGGRETKTQKVVTNKNKRSLLDTYIVN